MTIPFLIVCSTLVAASPQGDTLQFEPWTRVHTKSISSVDFGSDFNRPLRGDASFLVSGSQDGSAIIWDIVGKKVRHKLVHIADEPAARLIVNRVRVEPTGRRIAVAGSNGQVSVWDARTGVRLKTLEGFTGRVYDVDWSGEGAKLAACDDDGKVIVWNTETWSKVRELMGDPGDQVLSSLSLSPDGAVVAFASRGDKLYLRNVDTGAKIATLTDLYEEPKAMRFSPDGKWIALAEAELLVLRSAVNGRSVRQLKGHAGTIRGIDWSRDSERLFTGGNSGEVFEWNVRTSAVLARGKVSQSVNDIALCFVGGVERLAIAKPSGIVEANGRNTLGEVQLGSRIRR
ncbi:MAG: hypothetical protein EDM74_13020 [Armatimonadetes bacterium]|nr:MAG: hypothetical protein EDM74_13020 [Armatimonadota bacterium]